MDEVKIQVTRLVYCIYLVGNPQAVVYIFGWKPENGLRISDTCLMLAGQPVWTTSSSALSSGSVSVAIRIRYSMPSLNCGQTSWIWTSMFGIGSFSCDDTRDRASATSIFFPCRYFRICQGLFLFHLDHRWGHCNINN